MCKKLVTIMTFVLVVMVVSQVQAVANGRSEIPR